VSDTEHGAREALARRISGQRLLFAVVSVMLGTELDRTLDHRVGGRGNGCNM
jgi:hypothetical protein